MIARVACAAAVLLVLGCSPDLDGPEQPVGPVAPASPLRGDDVDRLRALGYLTYSPDVAADDLSRGGVTSWDPARSQPGYNLYSEQFDAIAVLIDAEGNELHRFADPDGRYWSRVVLLPDGDLLAVGAEGRGAKRGEIDPSGRYVLRMGWDGEVRWKRLVSAHHDVEVLADGRILTLTMRDRLIEAVDPDALVRDNGILVLSQDGEVLEEHSLYDLLSAGPAPFEFHDVGRRMEQAQDRREQRGLERLEVGYVDLLHANSIEAFNQPALRGQHPIYRDDSLLITSRHQDCIAVVSIEQGELRWAWGEGELAGPHDASWLPDGNILVFDNGLGLGRSRLLEVDPRTDRIVWEYQGDPPESFYTASRGSARRLANGNTLVTHSSVGQAFEITREGRIVWDFWNPQLSSGARQRRASLGRMERLDPSRVEPLLTRFGSGVAGE